MWRCVVPAILITLFSSCREEQNRTTASTAELPSVVLKSIDGKDFSVRNLLEGNCASVFFFLMPGCPMCEWYSLSIREAKNKFSDKGIAFYGIFSSDNYSDEEIISFSNNYEIDIPSLRDRDFTFAHALGAKVTPEVFILDSTAAILYSGSIDNWAYAAGKVRMEATEFFLNDALENIVSGKQVIVKSTNAYGCLIE
jgi:peroxiredoxin